MRATIILALVLVGCHGTDLRVGTSYSQLDGGSSGSVQSGGYHGGVGFWDVDNGDSNSLWVELGFQLTPQTVVIRHADDHGLQPLYPPRPVVEQLQHPPPAMEPPPPPCPASTASAAPGDAAPVVAPSRGGRDIDWGEIVIAIVGLIAVIYGGKYTGKYAVNVVKTRRARRAACPPKPKKGI